MNIDKHYDIAVLPGDGIGTEVMAACLDLLRAAEAKFPGARLRFTEYECGAHCYARTGTDLPKETLDACRRADAILFGAGGWPDIRYPDGTEIAPQLELRLQLELFAGVRPIRWFPGLPQLLTDPRAQKIDYVLVREQTEGLFYSRGRGRVEADEAYDTMRITRAGTQRVSEFACTLAERRKTRGGKGLVTCVDKANVFASMAFFRKVFDETAAKHPTIEAEHAYIDATALNMIRSPWHFDVVVTENMFGDILSDLGAGLIGGMGMAPSGDVGLDHALFQPAHGSAPDIAGQGKANPCAMFLSAAMMLDWLGDRHGDEVLHRRARAIESAIEKVLSSKHCVPFDYGGTHGTQAITAAVGEALA